MKNWRLKDRIWKKYRVQSLEWKKIRSEKVQSWNVLQPIESNTDNFEEKLKGIQGEIEIQKSRQILTNKTIQSQKMEIDKTQELLEDKSATITAKLEGMYSKF